MRKLITYDLHWDRDYDRLYDALKRIGACRAMFSVWIYSGPETPQEVRNYLGGYIDADDTLLVVEYRQTWASLRLPHEAAECVGPYLPG